MRFRLAFWHRDYPAAGPGDVIEVPDAEVSGLVKAGIGHPEESAAAPAGIPAAALDQPPAVPPTSPKTTAKAAKAD